MAREAEICYATLTAVTDYDCWHETEEIVTVDVIISNLKKNTENAKKVLKDVILRIDDTKTCSCHDALKYAVITHPTAIPEKTKRELGLLIGKYVPVPGVASVAKRRRTKKRGRG